jgi:hypothetical protein
VALQTSFLLLSLKVATLTKLTVFCVSELVARILLSENFDLIIMGFSHNLMVDYKCYNHGKEGLLAKNKEFIQLFKFLLNTIFG